jgi:hypothetical protein
MNEKTTPTIGPGVRAYVLIGIVRAGLGIARCIAQNDKRRNYRSGAIDSCGTSTAHSLKELRLSRFKTFPLQALRKKFSTHDKNVAGCCVDQARL